MDSCLIKKRPEEAPSLIGHQVVPGKLLLLLLQVLQGGYFGELALVNHDRRAATVVAKDDVKVACEFPTMTIKIIFSFSQHVFCDIPIR